ncbi:ornithine cyclodeaminase family protein [Novosphingobium sp. RL4]|uniref:ornithine cyclodeaminase family protein n=1 Tax=Novosphingobium sp. RL4 TaxID=3109595 RepID=UPI002D7737EC|nr:ornithine cyclodeaminase family protein [Novosphingobium sp. RL4]WRT94448.1 ornithine cyclodeaminase family protein [Novosphingobium sp. RL4]
MSDPIWITEQDVVELLSLPEAIDALRVGLAEEAAGHATNMVKTHVIWGGHATLHAIGAVFEGKGFAGTKTWAHTEGGAMPLLVLIDSNDGSVRAIIEAFALGQMRTGGISGVATDLLARPDARRMAMIGAGKQSLAQIAAVAAVRPLDRVAVWSPTPAKREALAAKTEDALGIETIAASTLGEALDGADIITAATRATAPFLTSEMLARGVHLNAVGAITPERAEFDPALLSRATVTAADSVPQVRKLSREFIEAYGSDEAKWQGIRSLGSLVGDAASRPADADLTVFKAMGMGISDLSLGLAIFERAVARGLGRPIPRPTRAAPRLKR